MQLKKVIILFLFIFSTFIQSLDAKTRALEISKLDEISILSSLDINTSFRVDPTYVKMKNNIDKIKTLYFLKALKKGSIFMPNLHELLGDSDIPDTFLYMAMVESKFVAGVKSKRNAAGLWQLMPATARQFHLEISKDIDERLDPIKSTKAAISYLKYLHKRFGKWYLATLAYNCGETKLAKVLREVPNDNLSTLIDDELKYLPTETRNYMRRIVIAAMLAYDNEIIIKNDADHLFGNCTNSKLIEVFFNGGSTLVNIANNVGMSLDKIKSCNPHLLQSKIPEDKETYHVYLPEEFVKDLNSSKITVGRFTYKVKEGDTVSLISKRYNIKMSTIKKLNPSISSFLRIGQNITLIGQNKEIKTKKTIKKKKIIDDINSSEVIKSTLPTFKYIIKENDTISIISKKFNIRISTIKKLNPSINSILNIGQNITLIGENKVIDLNRSKDNTSKNIEKSEDINKTKLETFVYTVRDGDSISKIAQRFNNKLSIIHKLNPTVNTILITGQKLKLLKHKVEFPYITEKLKALQGK